MSLSTVNVSIYYYWGQPTGLYMAEQRSALSLFKKYKYITYVENFSLLILNSDNVQL